MPSLTKVSNGRKSLTMNVILDTCILIQDYKLQSRNFIGLFEYLRKTKGKIIIFDYVLDELLKNYESDLEEFYKNVSKSSRKLLGNEFQLNVKAEVKSYQKFIEGHESIRLLKSDDVSSKIIFQRHLKRKPPFKTNGSGVADFLIWDCITKLSNADGLIFYAFISSNSSDYGKETLHPELLKDLKYPSQVIFYNSLENFLTEYGKKIDFINENNIFKFLEGKSEYIRNYIDVHSIKYVGGIINRDTDVASIDNFTIDDLTIDSYFIYGLKNGVFNVQVEIEILLLLQLSVYENNSDKSKIYESEGSTSCLLEIPIFADQKTEEFTINKSEDVSVFYRK